MTTQFQEILIHNEETIFTNSEPLRDYLKTVELPHKLVAPHTACWRGYFSRWEIMDNKLFLVDWKGFILDYKVVFMDYLFPNQEKVFASWFSGKISSNLGDPITYHHGLGYTCEGLKFLVFQKGILVEEYEEWLTKEEIEKIIEEDRNIPF